MQGLEFIVAHDPIQYTAAEMAQKTDAAAAPKEPSNVWVIRKQTRRKRAGLEEDEVTILSTYFVVGDFVYMAPSVSSIIGSRMVRLPSELVAWLFEWEGGFANSRIALDCNVPNEGSFDCLSASDFLAFVWTYVYASGS